MIILISKKKAHQPDYIIRGNHFIMVTKEKAGVGFQICLFSPLCVRLKCFYVI